MAEKTGVSLFPGYLEGYVDRPVWADICEFVRVGFQGILPSMLSVIRVGNRSWQHQPQIPPVLCVDLEGISDFMACAARLLHGLNCYNENRFFPSHL